MLAGNHFLQIPGPSPEPSCVLDAVSSTTVDHRGPEFQRLGVDVLHRVRRVFQTESPVMIYSASGTGAWEAALVNTLRPGDRVVFYEAGHFARQWYQMASSLGLDVVVIESSWRRGIDPDRLAALLRDDHEHEIKAVCCVHNETSTGVTNDVAAVRGAIDSIAHPALLIVDTISGLGAADYRHDEWGVDVSIACSQKGLMLPPGLGFNAVSARAMEAHQRSEFPRSYWDWTAQLAFNAEGFWPTTPSTNLLYGLQAALSLIEDEGLGNVLSRHERWGVAVRAAVRVWGLELLCIDDARYSPVLTAVLMPDEYDADAFRSIVLERFDMSLGAGLGKFAGSVFRIGHLGWTNDLTILGALSGVQMGLELIGFPVAGDGVVAAQRVLQEQR